MDGEAGWWTTSGNIGLPPLARAMGVGRQQHKEITSLLVNKYDTLYSSVPTDANTLNQLHSIINKDLASQQLQVIVVTPDIIAQCIQQVKKENEM